MLMLGRLAFVLTGPPTGELPFKLGPMWRGALGLVLRESVCSQPPDLPCVVCTQVYSCAYGQFYETQAPPEFQQLASSGVPAPLALYVSEHIEPVQTTPRGATNKAGTSKAITLVEYSVLGHALLLLPALVQAVQRLLARAQGLGPQRSHLQLSQLIWEPSAGDASTRQMLAPNLPLYFAPVKPPMIPPVPSAIVLRSLTPLRINHQGRALTELTPQDFLRRLLRRMSLLCAIYHYPPPEPALLDLLVHVRLLANDWQQIKQSRQSSRQQRQVPVGGLHGWMRFALPPVAHSLWPWLWMGQFLHIGQGSTQGFGRYALDYEEGA